MGLLSTIALLGALLQSAHAEGVSCPKYVGEALKQKLAEARAESLARSPRNRSLLAKIDWEVPAELNSAIEVWKFNPTNSSTKSRVEEAARKYYSQFGVETELIGSGRDLSIAVKPIVIPELPADQKRKYLIQTLRGKNWLTKLATTMALRDPPQRIVFDLAKAGEKGSVYYSEGRNWISLPFRSPELPYANTSAVHEIEHYNHARQTGFGGKRDPRIAASPDKRYALQLSIASPDHRFQPIEGDPHLQTRAEESYGGVQGHVFEEHDNVFMQAWLDFDRAEARISRLEAWVRNRKGKFYTRAEIDYLEDQVQLARESAASGLDRARWTQAFDLHDRPLLEETLRWLESHEPKGEADRRTIDFLFRDGKRAVEIRYSKQELEKLFGMKPFEEKVALRSEIEKMLGLLGSREKRIKSLRAMRLEGRIDSLLEAARNERNFTSNSPFLNPEGEAVDVSDASAGRFVSYVTKTGSKPRVVRGRIVGVSPQELTILDESSGSTTKVAWKGVGVRQYFMIEPPDMSWAAIDLQGMDAQVLKKTLRSYRKPVAMIQTPSGFYFGDVRLRQVKKRPVLVLTERGSGAQHLLELPNREWGLRLSLAEDSPELADLHRFESGEMLKSADRGVRLKLDPSLAERSTREWILKATVDSLRKQANFELARQLEEAEGRLVVHKVTNYETGIPRIYSLDPNAAKKLGRPTLIGMITRATEDAVQFRSLDGKLFELSKNAIEAEASFFPTAADNLRSVEERLMNSKLQSEKAFAKLLEERRASVKSDRGFLGWQFGHGNLDEGTMAVLALKPNGFFEPGKVVVGEVLGRTARGWDILDGLHPREVLDSEVAWVHQIRASGEAGETFFRRLRQELKVHAIEAMAEAAEKGYSSSTARFLKERRSEYEIFAPDQLPEQVVGKRVAVHLREGVRTGSSERVLHGEIVGRKGGAIELRTKEAEHGTWLAASEVQSVAVRNETRTAEKALDRMAQGWSSGWSETASFGPFVEENRGSFRSFSGDQFSAALKADPGKFANHWVTFHYRPRDFISDHGEEVLLRFDENPLRKDGRLGLYASHGRNYTEVNLKNLEFVSVYENPNQPGRTAAALVDAWKQERGGLAGNYRIPDLGKFHAPAPGPSDFFKSFEFGDAVIADVQEAPYKPRELIVGRVVSNGDYRKSISLYDEASGKTVSLTEGSIFHSLHVSPANASWKLEKFRRKFSNFNAAHIQEAISALLAPSQERHVLLRLWPDRGTAQFLYGRIEKLGTDPAQAVYVLTDSQGARHEIDFLKQESFEIGAPQVKAPHPESLFWGTGVRP